MLELCPQSIEILLPCEPFRKTSSEIIGEDLYIRFEPSVEVEKCPHCGEEQRVHAWRWIRLDGPQVGIHRHAA